MATTRKIIGSVPIFRGEYKSSVKYYKQNIVTYYDSAFISTVDENMSVPCVIENNAFSLQDGWDFFIDNSELYFFKESEIDLPQEEFDELKEQGLLDITKIYYTYEEDNI